MSQTGPSNAGVKADEEAARPSARRNVGIAAVLGLLVAFMVGMSFAAVPLYRIFCAATGYRGTPQRADSLSDRQMAETVTVRFDTNVAPNLPWTFKPLDREVTLKVGENKLAVFRATNNSNETISGTATFNVAPDIMGAYFVKVQCFCFQEQTLRPGETAELPVSFYVDPALLKDPDVKNVREITLSYTFFRARTPLAKSAAAGGEPDAASTNLNNSRR